MLKILPIMLLSSAQKKPIMLNIMLMNLRNMPLLTGFDCLIKVFLLKLTGFLALLVIVTVLLEYNDQFI